MKFSSVMITCAGREEVCRKTLANLEATDWPKEFWPKVRVDDSQAERPQERQEQNSKAALTLALEDQSAEYVVFFEDDLEFNRHIWHNLTLWKPLTLRWVGMASLYNPNIYEIRRNHPEHWFQAHPNHVYGSQCYILSRAAAEACVARWAEIPGMQDIKISRIVASETLPIFYHWPSLVQHVGKVSAWGSNYFHYATDYSADFKA